MRAFPSLVVGTLGLLAAAPAFGACAAKYGSDTLLEDLSTVESFLLNGDNEAAAAAAGQLETKLACLGETLPPMIMARVYRGVAGGLYVGGNLIRSKDWFATAISVDPTFGYGTEDLPGDHPIVSLYSDARTLGVDDPIVAEGVALVDGVHYVDGKKVTSPTATPGMPHVYQLTMDGQTQSWLIEGVQFPPDVLKETGEKVAVAGKEPKPEKADKKPATAASSTGLATVTTIQRKRPGEKTPLMIAGGAIMAGAGGVYFMAAGAKADFEAASTAPMARQYYQKTNNLVVASGVVLAVGAGALTWGMIVSDQGTPIPAFHLRF